MMISITLGRYVLASMSAALAVVWHAFSSRREYFAAMYYLGTSKLSIAVLGNLMFMMALLVYKFVTKICLGRLRDSEVERITERFHHGIIEICLTLTVFRQEFDGRLIILMGVLTMIKVFHWLIQDRINYIQTESVITRLQHVRTVSLLSILLVLDVLFTRSSVLALQANDKGYQLLFMFEYGILACIICACFIKYGLAVIDNAMTETWENKGLYLLYLELGLDLANFLLYVAFFAMIMRKYVTIPLHLIRDIYTAYISLVRQVTNYARYRTVTSKIHQLVDATEADVEHVGGSCIICREDMALQQGLKKLPCGHVFHLSCLRSWLERQQTCPICRNSIIPNTPTASVSQIQPANGENRPDGPQEAGEAPNDAPAGPEPRDPATNDSSTAGGSTGVLPDTNQRAATASTAQPSSAVHDVSGSGHNPASQQENPLRSQPITATTNTGQNPVISSSEACTSSTSQASGAEQGPSTGQRRVMRLRHMGAMPPHHDASPEVRSAFQAASKAFASMAPYYMPIYQPYGFAPSASGDIATGSDIPGSAVPDQGAPEGVIEHSPSSSAQARAEQIANAAVAASIAATKQLLEGHIALLQERLNSLPSMPQPSIRPESQPADASGNGDGNSN